MSFVPSRTPSAPSEFVVPRRVLVADDDPVVRHVTAESLMRLGVEVRAVADGDEFLECFEARPGDYDGAVLDARMPGPPLRELVRRIRGRNPDLAIVVATGDPHEAEWLLSGDPARVLAKPYRVAELAHALTSADPVQVHA